MRTPKRRAWLILLGMLLVSHAWAMTPFVIKDIKLEGLQRTSPGTLFNYLPLNVGDTLNDARSSEAIRALFKTGFFDDVRFAQDGDTLIITVKERPSISSIKITGNKDIKTEDLTKAMKQSGLAEGRIFDRSLLDKVERELQRQYFSQGKYGVKIKAKVTPLERNRVDISIDVVEGKSAKIHQIAIVGNAAFSDEVLLKQLQITTPTLFSFFTSSDQYSKQKLAADLETLRSYYLDRGYINFNIDSTQVSITPDKRDVYITINITEGEKFTVKEVKLAGDLIVPEEDLRKLISVAEGAVFSRKAVTESAAQIAERLGSDGYAFANVNPNPEVEKLNKQVSVTFMVDPGKRVYVRRINVAGNARTRDEVVRREMRQMEGGVLATDKINRSRIRLQRLGFFQDISIETPAVPGTTDQVDVNVNVTERSLGSLTAAVGFSQVQGLLLSASISQDNFLGSGKRISAEVNNSRVNTIYSFSYTDPYHTPDGVSRGFRGFFRQTNATRLFVGSYLSDVFGAGVNYGFPLSEHNTARLSFDYEHTRIRTTSFTPRSYVDFLNANGDTFGIIKMSGGWTHDTRNRAIFADNGMLQSLSAEMSVPGSGLQFYKVSSRTQVYRPLTKSLTLVMNGEVAYGDSYGGTSALPFWERYYAGGVYSVRGFRANSLGLRENNRALGGALKLVGSTEVIFPVPFMEESKSFRLSAFFDIGNVYTGIQQFSAGDLRYSAGVAAIWLSPMGPLNFNLARPLNKKAGDVTESFQFSLGTFF
ncbi:MAG: outer membrane protein assembly factor BamA [Gammaproteobacteria bacterium]|nr:outer membrane protein assembly factor BamA [Gammaproteobacteria bacterium]